MSSNTRTAKAFSHLTTTVAAFLGVSLGVLAILYAAFAKLGDFESTEVAVAHGTVSSVVEKRGGVYFKLKGEHPPFAIAMVGADRSNVLSALRQSHEQDVRVVYRRTDPYKPWFTDEEHYSVAQVEIGSVAVITEDTVRHLATRERIGLLVFGLFTLLLGGAAVARELSAARRRDDDA